MGKLSEKIRENSKPPREGDFNKASQDSAEREPISAGHAGCVRANNMCAPASKAMGKAPDTRPAAHARVFSRRLDNSVGPSGLTRVVPGVA